MHFMQCRSVMTLDKAFRMWEDLKFPPNKTVYPKDGVSRARNIIVYRGDYIRLYILTAGWLLVSAGLFALYFIYHAHVYGLRPIVELPEDTDDLEDLEYRDMYDLDNNPYFRAMILVFASCLLGYMHLLHRRYIIRMYYDESKKMFTCVTYRSLVPWLTKTFKVKAGDAVVRPKGTYTKFSWTCTLAGRKAIVQDVHFKYPVYFNVLFGYEDPQAITKLNDSDVSAEEIFRRKSIEIRK